MAEAVGLAASFIQIISLAVKCSEALNRFSTSLSHERKNVQELCRHVDSNSRVLSRFADLLQHDALLKTELRQDIELAVEGCRNVFDEILQVHDSASTPRSGVARILQKTKYAAFDEARVDKLRARLSQNQTTLNLMLFIHWRVPEVEQSTPALADILRGSINEALHSSVPSIAQALRDCLAQISSLPLANELDGSTLNESSTAEPERRSSASSSLSSSAPTRASPASTATLLSNAPRSTSSHHTTLPPWYPSLGLKGPPAAVPSTRSLALHPSSPSSSSAPLNTSPFQRSSTQASTISESIVSTQRGLPPLNQVRDCSLSEEDPASPAARTMWLALVTSPGNIIFEKQPISALHIDQFVLDKATNLMAGLSKLDPAARSSLNAHVSKLQERLIAIQVHRQHFLRKRMQSMDVVTERVALPTSQYTASCNPQSHESDRMADRREFHLRNGAEVGGTIPSQRYSERIAQNFLYRSTNGSFSEPACACCVERRIKCDGQDPLCKKRHASTQPTANYSDTDGQSYGRFESLCAARIIEPDSRSGTLEPASESEDTDSPSDYPPSIQPDQVQSHVFAGALPRPQSTEDSEPARRSPRCWEHGCNGREFTTFSNLLRHQREKSGAATKSYCPNCGAVFTRSTALSNHLQNACRATLSWPTINSAPSSGLTTSSSTNGPDQGSLRLSVRDQLRRHRCGTSPKEKCPDCGREFTRSTALSNHRQNRCPARLGQGQASTASDTAAFPSADVQTVPKTEQAPAANLDLTANYKKRKASADTDFAADWVHGSPYQESSAFQGSRDAHEVPHTSANRSSPLAQSQLAAVDAPMEEPSCWPENSSTPAADPVADQLGELDFGLLARELDRTLRMRWEEPAQPSTLEPS